MMIKYLRISKTILLMLIIIYQIKQVFDFIINIYREYVMQPIEQYYIEKTFWLMMKNLL